jgi:LEA14-like dessication related protein
MKYHPVILMGLILLLFSCSTIQQLTKIQNPKLSVKTVRITDFDFSDIYLTFDLQVENPNNLSISLAGFDYHLFLNNQSFLKGNQKNTLEIRSNETTIFEIPLSLNFKNIYQTYQTLKDEDSLSYKVDFGLNFKLPIVGETRLPLSTTGNVPLIKIPPIKLSSIKLQKLNLTGAEINLNLQIINPNFFEFKMNQLNYNLNLNGNPIASGQNDNQQIFKGKSENLLRIPISLDFLQMGETTYKLFTGSNEVVYDIDGNLDISTSSLLLKNLDLPFHKSGNLRIQR